MELLQIDRLDAQVLQALLGVFANVVRREAVVERIAPTRGPLEIPGWNLGRQVETLVGMVLHEPAQDMLAPAASVGPGGVVKIASERDRPVERNGCLIVVRASPSRQPPHAVTDLADLPARLPERPINHESILPIRSHCEL